MLLTLTLVTPTEISDDTLSRVAALLPGAQFIRRLSGVAADVTMDAMSPAAFDACRPLFNHLQADHAIQPSEERLKKVLVADMDSTIIEQECLDELAAMAGIGEEIAAITERAMRGELDFEEALKARVARLNGLPASTIDDVLLNRITVSKGAETLIRTMNDHGATTALVSGGFTRFTEAVAARVGFSHHRGNVLDVDRDGHLTGTVAEPILGRDAKRAALEAFCLASAVSTDAAIALGDGANDLAMIERAGLGVAYRAKPIVANAANGRIEYTDLTSLLYFQGITPDHWTC